MTFHIDNLMLFYVAMGMVSIASAIVYYAIVIDRHKNNNHK